MVDFSKLYQKPAGTAKRPPRLLSGDYPGIIRQFEKGESKPKPREDGGVRGTPFYRYHVLLTGFPQGISSTWSEVDDDGKTWNYTLEDLDLSKRPQTFEFYFPVNAEGDMADSAIWRFDEFLRSLEIEPEGQSYEVLEQAPVGRQVLLSMTQQLATDGTNRIFVRPTKMTGLQA